MIKLARFLKNYRKQLILGPMFKIIEAVFELIVPLVIAKIIDVGVNNADKDYIIHMGMILVLLSLVGFSCTLVCQYLASVASQGTGTALRSALFKHINTLNHSEFDKLGTHTLTLRLTNDINQLQVAVAMLIRLVIRAPFLVAGAIVMTLSTDIKLSLIILAVTPFLAYVLYFIMNRSVPFFRLMQEKLDKISLITRENLNGERVIRAFSKQKEEKERFIKAGDELAETAVNVGRLSALLNPLTSLIMNAGIVAIIWLGGFRVNLGMLTQGELVAFLNYMTQILIASLAVANMVVIFTKASASAARVNEIFDIKPSMDDNNAEACGLVSATAVKFDDVCFSYDKPVLKNINLQFNVGETIGIIGGTGSGKTTLINLILRFYDVTSGSVEVFGSDVKDLRFKKLRKIVGIVPQQASVMSGSIRENILWGKENAKDTEVFEALNLAQADFVTDLDFQIDQGGKNLSGGQKQRLTIARAIVSKPPILILDDSSSALDAATDYNLRKALRESYEGMTLIMVSQRAGSIKHADKIVVMDDGAVVGVGVHENLLKDCNIYHEICKSQGVV